MINLENKTVLVTGGAGFIGSNFIEYIDKIFNGMTIINVEKHGVGSRSLDHLLVNEEGSQNSGGKFFICKTQKTVGGNNYWEAAGHLPGACGYSFDLHTFEFSIDYCFHFAAESHVDRSIDSPVNFVFNNVVGLTSLLDFLRKKHPKARIINISTDEVYGHLDMEDKPFTEDSPLAPRSPYAASKAAADLVALSYHSTYGMDVVVTRCCNNYGKHQHDEKFIPTVIRSLVEGKKIPVYGNGQNVREWIRVDDHNKAILEIAEIGESGGVYNVGSGVEMSNLDMINCILDIFHGEYKVLNDYVEFVEDRKGHDFRYAIESVRWVNNLEQKSFMEGLKETVEFYKNKYKGRN